MTIIIAFYSCFKRRIDIISFNDSDNDLLDDELKKEENKKEEENLYTEDEIEEIEAEISDEVENFDVADEAEDEELVEEDEDEASDDIQEDKPEKKSYPSIEKILKETKNSDYYDEYEVAMLLQNFNEKVSNIIEEINQANPGNLEAQVTMTYMELHNMTIDYMERKESILESDETNKIYADFYIYKEVLKRKRTIYLNDLAEANIKTVYYVVKKFRVNNSDYEELVSVGMMGYAKALDKFSPVRGIKFATFAIHCIYNEILFHLRKEKKIQQNNTSINTKLSTDKNGNDLVLEDIIPDTNPTPAEHIQNDARRQILLQALKELSCTGRFIMIYRYGLDRGIILTQKDIAKKLDMSQANISKIEKTSLEALNESLRNQII